MLPSPADSGPDRRSASGQPGGEGGLLAAPVAEALTATDPGVNGLSQASIRSGGCFARPLPLDRTCASVARRYFREAVAGMNLPADLVHDGVTMTSELAANTLHAQGNVEFSGSRQRPVSGMPELWLYLRGRGAGCELVCKVFDSGPCWGADDQPRPDPATPDSVSGRGLQVVAELSGGRWGKHPTRGRLGSWKVPGKAVWFALRVPAAAAAVRSGRPEPVSEEAVDDLEAMLADRGLGGRLVRIDDPGGRMSVLSISRHLTLWRNQDTVSWRTPAGTYRRLQLRDLVEVAEQIICAHEQLARPSASC
jgi:anti-sigma regulatory factor (Ser/Thr protein kinase)